MRKFCVKLSFTFSSMISQKIKTAVRDIVDFPKPGIIFKDITPILQNPELCSEILDAFEFKLQNVKVDVVAGIESRGFLFGLMLAMRLKVPFVPVRKSGKLPFTTINQSYDLEYGSTVIELHTDAFKKGQRVLIHDDLLATGGTVNATKLLIERMGGIIAGFSFVIGLGFLGAAERISISDCPVIVLADYK